MAEAESSFCSDELPQCGQATASPPRTSVSNVASQLEQRYS
jgi:hypothetical protein